jgi:hypothetical protein
MRREFFKSPHHAALAAATLGVGFATGEPLYFILGAAAYVLGWVYLPDLVFLSLVGRAKAASPGRRRRGQPGRRLQGAA